MVQKNPTITEEDDERKIKFTQFHKKIIDNRLVSFWNNQEELTSKFVTNLELTIIKFPMQGWIRCNSDVCGERLQFIDINSKISSLKIATIKSIHIMASGTSSYIPIVKNLLKKNRQKNITVNIYIFFRLGSNQQRLDYFRNQYDYWWNTLKSEYPKIKFHFTCVDDFMMLEGIFYRIVCSVLKVKKNTQL